MATPEDVESQRRKEFFTRNKSHDLGSYTEKDFDVVYEARKGYDWKARLTGYANEWAKLVTSMIVCLTIYIFEAYMVEIGGKL